MLLIDLLRRVAKEARFTLEGLRETVIAVAERVNRRVHVLRLHAQAVTVQHHIQSVHRSLGVSLCELVGATTRLEDHSGWIDGTLASKVSQAAGSVRLLERELEQIATRIRALEVEALHEDLQKLQQDLTERAATVRRCAIPSGARAVGQAPHTLGLPSTTRIAAILRGPVLLPVSPGPTLRAGDVVILIGPHTELVEAERLLRDGPWPPSTSRGRTV
ncbi:hypothetical protein [Candidatus Nitrospira bockiana]